MAGWIGWPSGLTVACGSARRGWAATILPAAIGRLFTPADGLAHMIVRAIHVTPEGVVWVGTEGGVSRYVPPD